MNVYLIVSCALVVLMTVFYVLSVRRSEKELSRTRTERRMIFRNCFLNGLAGILAKMTKSDGETTEAESAVAMRLFDNMGLPAEDREICRRNYTLAAGNNLPGSYYASLFVPYATRESRLLVYEILWDIAAADGSFAPGEDRFLKDLVTWLDLSQSDYDLNLKNHAGKFSASDETLRAALGRLDGMI